MNRVISFLSTGALNARPRQPRAPTNNEGRHQHVRSGLRAPFFHHLTRRTMHARLFCLSFRFHQSRPRAVTEFHVCSALCT